MGRNRIKSLAIWSLLFGYAKVYKFFHILMREKLMSHEKFFVEFQFFIFYWILRKYPIF